jgi:AraC-like DNA-binding protein
MPGSATGSFNDPTNYCAGLGDIFAGFVVTAPGAFSGRAARITLRHLHLLRAHETLPRVAYATLPPETAFVSFSCDPAAPLIWGGQALGPDEIMSHPGGSRLHQRTVGPGCWGFISLPQDSLAASMALLAGRTRPPPRSVRILRPTGKDRAHLLRMHAEAARLAETKPQMLVHPEVVRAMEHELTSVLVSCLTESEARIATRDVLRDAEIMERFEGFLAANLRRKPGLAELREAVRASDRAIRACCAKFLGVTPQRYIRLRRLAMVRAAILRAESTKARIGELARSGGFNDRGHFAVIYRSAYGETPSATLRYASRG